LHRRGGAAPSKQRRYGVKNDKARGPPPPARAESDAPYQTFTECRHDPELSTAQRTLPIVAPPVQAVAARRRITRAVPNKPPLAVAVTTARKWQNHCANIIPILPSFVTFYMLR
jgi:hypothetical protein